jgi:hypothetical protein
LGYNIRAHTSLHGTINLVHDDYACDIQALENVLGWSHFTSVSVSSQILQQIPMMMFFRFYQTRLRKQYPSLPEIYVLMDMLFPTIRLPSFKKKNDVNRKMADMNIPPGGSVFGPGAGLNEKSTPGIANSLASIWGS